MKVRFMKQVILHMRTDSTSLSNDAMKMIHKYIVDTYGEKLFFKILQTRRNLKSSEA